MILFCILFYKLVFSSHCQSFWLFFLSLIYILEMIPWKKEINLKDLANNCSQNPPFDSVKCPKNELYLVHIFRYSNWIREIRTIKISHSSTFYAVWKDWCNMYMFLRYRMKNVLIWSFCSLYFPAFGLNTERYGVSVHIQSKCGKMRTKKTPNTDTFHA